MNKRYFAVAAMMLALVVIIAACAPQAAPSGQEQVVEVTKIVEVTKVVEVAAEGGQAATGLGSTLKTVQDRGTLICGGNARLPGFGFLDEQGNYSGFDVDFCHALAAAVLGDANAIEIRPLTAKERFTALQTGEIDVLIRNTTWTLTRDTDLGGNFVHTTFYDGQGMMVRKDSGIQTLEDLEGGTICVSTGTTTELNLADQMASRGINYTPVVLENADQTFGAYEEGRCDAVTTDKSGLVSRQSVLAVPSDHVILDVTMSKEPLGPMVRHGDDQWFDIVQWTVFATFTAEEFGITSENVDEVRSSTTDPNVKKLLGLEGEMGTKLGLSDDWAYNIIKQVGNYGEIYDRNLGPNTVFNLPRGLNALYTDGGLLYAPPFR